MDDGQKKKTSSKFISSILESMNWTTVRWMVKRRSSSNELSFSMGGLAGNALKICTVVEIHVCVVLYMPLTVITDSTESYYTKMIISKISRHYWLKYCQQGFSVPTRMTIPTKQDNWDNSEMRQPLNDTCSTRLKSLNKTHIWQLFAGDMVASPSHQCQKPEVVVSSSSQRTCLDQEW